MSHTSRTWTGERGSPQAERKEAFPSCRTVSSPDSDTTLPVPSRTEFHTFHFLLHMLQSLWKNSLHVMTHPLYIFTFLCVLGLWKGFFIILFLNFTIQSSYWFATSPPISLSTFKWPCIVTNFVVIKPTRCTNFTNLFLHETLHVLDSSSVQHHEFIHCTLSNGICCTGL